VLETAFIELTDEELAQHQEYFNAVAVLRSDESSEETRQQAREKLVEICGKMLDADLEDRKEEVTTLEKRVTKMRTQLDKRKAAQDQIIDLKMKTIQNEVDGLGGDSLKPLTSTEPLGSGRGYRNPLIVAPTDTTVEPVEIARGGLGFGGGRVMGAKSARPGLPGIARMGTMSDGESGFGAMGRTELQSRPTKAKTVYRTVIEEVRVALSPEELAENQQYESSLKVLKSDEGDDAKQAARNTIRQLLVTRFTRDLESREKDLVELESRVKKLREQLDKRIAARDQIIDLRMMTLQNEIDGLGFDGFQTSGIEQRAGKVVEQPIYGSARILDSVPAKVVRPTPKK
jgi:regulator of sigma D